ncbi:MAG: hypothetical protein MJD61_20410 [Proteobacteria bacterium]|nr:hypothetical protein [Pseudomonadota bacterium]
MLSALQACGGGRTGVDFGSAGIGAGASAGQAGTGGAAGGGAGDSGVVHPIAGQPGVDGVDAGTAGEGGIGGVGAWSTGQGGAGQAGQGGVGGGRAGEGGAAACKPGRADCDRFSGCETDLSRSTQHCGACGAACEYPNAGAKCVSGVCRLIWCPPGHFNCDGIARNGCESTEHCPGIGGSDGCPPGRAICNSSRGTCAFDLLRFNHHCGGCGVECNPQIGDSRCVSGVCTLVWCPDGHFDCDGDAFNGCETPGPCDGSAAGAGGSGAGQAGASGRGGAGGEGGVAGIAGFTGQSGSTGQGGAAGSGATSGQGGTGGGGSGGSGGEGGIAGQGGIAGVGGHGGFPGQGGFPEGCRSGVCTTNSRIPGIRFCGLKVGGLPPPCSDTPACHTVQGVCTAVGSDMWCIKTCR